jgi:hypothetical protein
MNNLIQSIKSRLDLIISDLKNNILSYMSSRSYHNYIKVKGIIINDHKITHLSYDNGWQMSDVILTYDKENYGYIRLSDITNVYVLLNIVESINNI